jgi:16S rRNA (guanine966-N2)-methyltransferase
MRIIAGALRGRRLVAPGVHSTRPTADRTRESIFNVLEHAPWASPIAGARVADLFAGSGALGLEALSRGADFCLFVESSPAAAAIAAQNVEALDCADRSRVLRGDAARAIPATEAPFDLVFLDPPYGKGLDARALAALPPGWLSPEATVVVERSATDTVFAPPGFTLLDARPWGAARVWFLTPAP